LLLNSLLLNSLDKVSTSRWWPYYESACLKISSASCGWSYCSDKICRNSAIGSERCSKYERFWMIEVCAPVVDCQPD